MFGWPKAQPNVAAKFVMWLAMCYQCYPVEQILENMVDRLKDEIMTRNFVQVITGPTRFWKDVQPSLIDH